MLYLIFALFFSTFGGVSTKAHDTSVKTDVARLLADTSEYMSNNNGAYPKSVDQIIASDDRFQEFRTWQTAGSITTDTAKPDTVYYAVGYECDASTDVMKPGRVRSASVVVLLPSGKATCMEV